MTPVAESIITTLSLHRCLAVVTLIQIEVHHGFLKEEVTDALADLILIKRVKLDGASLALIEKPWDHDQIPATAYQAADTYRRAHHPTVRDRLMVFIGNTWARIATWFDRMFDKIAGGLVLFIITAFFALGLCAVDVPDRIVAALVQVESGCEWRGMGEIRGTWLRGEAGEVSAFQLSPAALISMGAGDRSTRIHRDPVLAESFARLWLSRCFDQAGTWEGALARYNAGSRHRSRTARDYAARVLNLAAVL
jgi:hypothetical protein